MAALMVPITLGSTSKGGTKTLLEDCYSDAQPTCLCSWGLTNNNFDENSRSRRGLALGCQDGTIYLFRPSTSRPQLSLIHTSTSSIKSTPPSPRHAHSHSLSKSHISPFHLSERTGPVSGVSKEQVEAPKNYVDFDEEQEKLKEIVQSRPARSKGADGLASVKDKAGGAEKSSRPVSVGSRPTSWIMRGSIRDDLRTLLSANASPTLTPRSLSPPSTPSLGPSACTGSSHLSSLELKLHLFPSRFGTERPVVGLKSDDEGYSLISLQENGDLSIFSSQDGTCIASTSLESAQPMFPPSSRIGVSSLGKWYWKGLHIVETAESFIILTAASSSPAPLVNEHSDQRRSETSRVSVFLLENLDGREFGETTLKRVGDWCVNGPVDGIGLATTPGGALRFMHVDSSGSLTIESLHILPERVVEPSEDDPTKKNASSVNLVLPLPNPFKNARKRNDANTSARADLPGRIALEPSMEVKVGTKSCGEAQLAVLKGGIELYAAVWSEEELSVFKLGDTSLKTVLLQQIHGIKGVALYDFDTLLVLRGNDLCTHPLVPAALQPPTEGTTSNPKSLIESVLPLGDFASGLVDLSHTSLLLSTRLGHKKRRRIECLALDDVSFKSEVTISRKPQTLWKATSRSSISTEKPTITALLPLELDLIIAGYTDGRLRMAPLSKFLLCTDKPTYAREAERGINGSVASIHLIRNAQTGEQVLVTGGDDGSVAFWSYDSLALRERRVLFTTPLSEVLDPSSSQAGDHPPWNPHDESLGRVHGCILCIAGDGTIAVFNLDKLELLYMIPGSAASLIKVAIGEDNLLLMYSDGKARMWDLRTLEFWRSMNLEKADEILAQGGWWDSPVPISPPLGNLLTAAPCSSQGLDSARTVLLDVSALLQSVALHHGNFSGPVWRAQLLSLLSVLLPVSLDDEIDRIRKDKIKIPASDCIIGLASTGSSFSIPTEGTSREPWTLSPEYSAARLVALVSLLRLYQEVPDLERYANTLVSYYVVTLPDVLGSCYMKPSLAYLGRLWSRTRGEIHQAAQTVLETRVVRLSDEDTTSLVEQWQHRLPALQPEADKQLPSAALALLLMGFVASEKYSLLSASTLTDVSKSIVLYLYDEQSPHRSLAVELCARGFDVWQNYVEAMEMLRALFRLATTSQKSTISVHNIGQQARLAVLQIAAGNTPLFMTTLSMDIMHPGSIEHRRSIMQLIAFMIRKRPLVLLPNLPRLVEAVVKSLDPAASGSREAIFDTATEILGYVVNTYPTVDFHMESQRLAVCTSEGPIVMYDLKTATRLYVLEGHAMRPAACSFSPDGRRLVTVSLDEGAVLIWKVGTSFISFFNPGAPPRQGHGGSEPFKTYPFNVGDEAKMTIAATLEQMHFEWVGNRSVKLKIRNSVLTFAT